MLSTFMRFGTFGSTERMYGMCEKYLNEKQ
jgi:hypothetical protein